MQDAIVPRRSLGHRVLDSLSHNARILLPAFVLFVGLTGFNVWRGGEGEPVRGIGRRCFLVGDRDLSIMELHSLAFDAPAAAEK